MEGLIYGLVTGKITGNTMPLAITSPLRTLRHPWTNSMNNNEKSTLSTNKHPTVWLPLCEIMCVGLFPKQSSIPISPDYSLSGGRRKANKTRSLVLSCCASKGEREYRSSVCFVLTDCGNW
jgi:hypothetical protein